jgi:hypothetical protein
MKKDKALTGKDNQRLTKHKPTNQATNSALTSNACVDNKTNATIPSLSGVIDAKEWVDNGSKL